MTWNSVSAEFRQNDGNSMPRRFAKNNSDITYTEFYISLCKFMLRRNFTELHGIIPQNSTEFVYKILTEFLNFGGGVPSLLEFRRQIF